MDARRVDARGAQQPAEGEFDRFLRFPDDIGPAPGLV